MRGNEKMWGSRHDARLLRLWPTHSASEIAKEIGVTRNAVIGRYHRLANSYADYIRPDAIASAERRAARVAKNHKLTSQMLAAIAAGVPRDDAIVSAIGAGAQQAAVACVLGLCRERIRQIFNLSSAK